MNSYEEKMVRLSTHCFRFWKYVSICEDTDRGRGLKPTTERKVKYMLCRQHYNLLSYWLHKYRSIRFDNHRRKLRKTNMTLRIYIYFPLLLFSLITKAARVDSLKIPSGAMSKTYMTAVVLPNSYSKNQANYPVLYLLHGAGGHFSDWLSKTPNKSLVKNLSDQYNIIVVMPEGEVYSWYLDSPINNTSMFETYITKEVVQKIDATYRTVKSSKGRVITGLSMGGHGAMYLAIRHPEIFGAAGTMSGAMDMNYTKYNIASENLKSSKEYFKEMLGTSDVSNDIFIKNSIVNMIDTMKHIVMPFIIDCGVDDYLIDVNRELHHRLLYAGISHDYTERPGGHTWSYWENSLPYHVLFFHNILKKNDATVE